MLREIPNLCRSVEDDPCFLIYGELIRMLENDMTVGQAIEEHCNNFNFGGVITANDHDLWHIVLGMAELKLGKPITNLNFGYNNNGVAEYVVNLMQRSFDEFGKKPLQLDAYKSSYRARVNHAFADEGDIDKKIDSFRNSVGVYKLNAIFPLLAAAKALLCAEIHAILKGGAFDYDRHGAQCKLKGNKIVLFDHGSISYDIKEGKINEPNADDKRALGELLASSYTDAQNSKRSVSAVLISKMNDTSEFGESAHYIECFKRGLLALNDYIKHAGVNQEERDKVIQESIAQSVKTDLADSKIINGFQRGISDQHSTSTKSLYSLLTSSVILTDKKGKSLLQQGTSYLFNKLSISSPVKEWNKFKRYPTK